MAIVETHLHTGTIGTAPTLEGEGYDTEQGGGRVYTAGGVGQPSSIRFPGGQVSRYADFNIVPFIGTYFRLPAMPAANVTPLRVVDAGGSSLAAVLVDTALRVGIYQGLNPEVDISAMALTIGTWYRFEWRVSGGTQELRIFATEGSTPLETLTGASEPPEAGRWFVGTAWGAHLGGPYDLGTTVLATDWPNLFPDTTPWAVWDGAEEQPMTLDGMWNGTAVVPVTFDSIT